MTESNSTQTPAVTEALSAWYRAAVFTAIIGAAFSLIICVLMAVNFRRARIIDTPEDLKLLALRAEVPKRPDDKQLVPGIRELDLKIRQKRARAIFRSRSGSYLLLGGVIVFLIGAKCADSLKKKLPGLPSNDDPQKRQVRDAMWSRLAVSGGVTMLALGVYSLMAGPKVDFKGGPPVAPYPSIEQINKNWLDALEKICPEDPNAEPAISMLDVDIKIGAGSSMPTNRMAKRADAVEMVKVGIYDPLAALEYMDEPKAKDIAKRIKDNQEAAAMQKLQ